MVYITQEPTSCNDICFSRVLKHLVMMAPDKRPKHQVPESANTEATTQKFFPTQVRQRATKTHRRVRSGCDLNAVGL